MMTGKALKVECIPLVCIRQFDNSTILIIRELASISGHFRNFPEFRHFLMI